MSSAPTLDFPRLRRLACTLGLLRPDPIRVLRDAGRTMVGEPRLRQLRECCIRLRHTRAAFVECGVAKGGCLALMARDAGPRNAVWGFDSFEPLPPLTAGDDGSGQDWVGVRCCGDEGQAAVATTFRIAGLDPACARVVPGWYEDTLPVHRAAIGPIAVLRLDSDWYAATRFTLEQLYDQVIPGGFILLDDYGVWAGCRNAVDEFRRERDITSPMRTLPNDAYGAYWVKEGG